MRTVVNDFKALPLAQQHEAYSLITAAYSSAKDARRAELEQEIRQLGYKPGEVAKKPIKVKYRSPSGDSWSGVGALPKWAKQLGVSDKAGMERFKVGAEPPALPEPRL